MSKAADNSSRPTLQNIADQVGCTPQAVSRILNPGSSSTANFGEELCHRVKQVAQELGYVAKKRRKRGTSQRRLLFLMETSVEKLPYASASDGLLVSQAARWDCQPHIRFFGNDNVSVDELEELEDFITTNRMAGVICLVHSNPGLVDLCSRLRLPLIFINPNKIFERNCFLRNDEEGVRTALLYLSQLGLKDIAYVGPPLLGRTYPHHSVVNRREAMAQYSDLFGMNLCYTNARAETLQQQVDEVKALPGDNTVVIVSYSAFEGIGRIVSEQSRFKSLCLSNQSVDCFACLDLQTELMCELALQRMLLMIEKNVYEMPNVVIDPKLQLVRNPNV